MAKNKFTPTAKQAECINETNRSVAILAGAGSGKTAVLIKRIEKILIEGSANLSEIVAITFTEKAAGELIFRLTRDIPAKFRSDIELATITTIHGFCNKILREDAALAGISPDFKVLEEHASRILNHKTVSLSLKKMLKDGSADAGRLVEELDFRYAISLLEELVEDRWNSYRLKTKDQRQKTREGQLQEAALKCFEIIEQEISSEKQKMGALDFVDLEIKTLELFKNHKEVREKHQKRMRHLLVDEFQDTSDLQTEIIRALYDDSKIHLLIVGDPGQSIYGFRGANPDGIRKVREVIERNGGLSIELKENFRSSPQIIDFINSIFSAEVSDCFMALEAYEAKDPNSKVLKLDLGSEKLSAEEFRIKEANLISAYVKEMKESGQEEYKNIAILFKSLLDIGIYEKALKANKIPYYRSGGRTFLNQPEIKDILLCLKAINDPTSNALIYGLARSTIMGLSDEDCYRLSNGSGENLFTKFASNPRFVFLRELTLLKDYLSIPELIRKIVKGAHLFETFHILQPSGQPTANIEKLVSLTESITRGNDYNLETFLTYIDDLQSREIGINEPPIFSPHDDAIKLLTVHAAKGLEFNTIFLADLGRGSRNHALPYIIDKGREIGFKLTIGDNPIAEREKSETFEKIVEAEKEKEGLERLRLLYVATTRACNRLILPLPSEEHFKSDWSKILFPLAASLETIQQLEAEGSTSIKLDFPKIPAPYKGLANEQKQILTVSDLEAYYRCPQEYNLKYILGLPADRVTTKVKEMGANIIGNIVHAIIAIGITDKPQDELIIDLCREFGHPYPASNQLSKIKKHLSAYQKSGYHESKLVNVEHEIPFVFSSDDAIIKGTIDCIYQHDDGYGIVDFKTDHIMSAESRETKARQYRLQTLTYAVAAKKALKNDITKMVLLFLDAKEEVEINIDPSDFEEWQTISSNIIKGIKVRDFSIDNRQTPCDKCLYHFNTTCPLDRA